MGTVIVEHAGALIVVSVGYRKMSDGNIRRPGFRLDNNFSVTHLSVVFLFLLTNRKMSDRKIRDVIFCPTFFCWPK
jgi:hypothetical protein